MPRISKEEKEKVRRALLATAARHFAKHGLAGANINDISTDAGFARGTVYNYFPSKEALFAAVLHAGTEATVARARARGAAGTAREVLRALVEEDVVLTRRHQAFVKILVKELVSPQPATRALLEAATTPLRAAVRDALLAGQTEGTVAKTRSADALTTIFLGQLTMLYAEHWSSDGAFPTWDELPALLVDGFFDGHAAPTRGAKGQP